MVVEKMFGTWNILFVFVQFRFINQYSEWATGYLFFKSNFHVKMRKKISSYN